MMPRTKASYFYAFAVLAMALPLMVWGQASTSSMGKSSLSVISGPRQIVAGDLLNVVVFDTPELSGQVRVGEKGVAVLPLIGAVELNGLAPEQAQQVIAQRLRDGRFVKDPQVTVIVSEYASQAVTVIGEVAKPGAYPLVAGNRLFDILSQASGLSPVAGTRVKIIHRDQMDKPVQLAVRDAKGQISDSNVELLPGDTVIVERAGVIYVLGDVAKPGGYVMDHEQITVLEAIALAQGTTKTSSLNKARLLRRTASGVEQSKLPLKSILNAKVLDPILQAGDIVYVPGSLPKNAMQMGLQGILSSAAGSAIYAAGR